jgi:hypothetical protein
MQELISSLEQPANHAIADGSNTQREQWIRAVMSDPHIMDYRVEDALSFLLMRIATWKKSIGQLNIAVNMKSDVYNVRVHAMVRQTMHKFYRAESELSINIEGAHPVFRQAMNEALSGLAYDLFSKMFRTVTTAKMFLLYMEHFSADMNSHIESKRVEDFWADIGEAWKAVGASPSFSKGIHEATTSGYGDIDFNGFWMIPLPDVDDSEECA